MSKKRLKKSRRELARNLLFYNSLLLIITAVYAVVFVISRENGLSIFKCNFLSRFGFYCPGCGGSRSLMAILSFDFLSAFIYYPPLVFTLFLIVTADILSLISVVTGNMRYAEKFRREYFILVPASIFLSYAVRLILLLYGIDILGDAWVI